MIVFEIGLGFFLRKKYFFLFYSRFFFNVYVIKFVIVNILLCVSFI